MTIKLVLLPGFGGSGEVFLPLIKALPSSLMPEVLPLARSTAMSIEDHARYIRERLPREDPFVLLAQSFSGLIASHIAIDPPHNLKGVVLVSSYARPPRRFLLKLARRLPARLIRLVIRQNWIMLRFLADENMTPKRLRLLKDTLTNLEPALLRARLKLAETACAPSSVAPVPCIQIIATQDRLLSHHHVSDFDALYPRLMKFKLNGPHALLQAQPEFCARLLEAEVARLTPSAAE